MGRFEKFAKHQFAALGQHLENYLEKREPEDLHGIRVDIKKIKAILQFTNDRVKGFRGHKNYLPFRTIFRRAGEIREPEIVYGLLLAHNISGIHDQRIERSSKKLIEDFCKDIPVFIDSIHKQWTKLQPVFKKLKGIDLDKYLRKTRKYIKSKLYPKPDMRLIHHVRKSIKGFIYLSELDYQGKKKLTKFYKEEGTAIGELHDRQVLLKMVVRQNGSADPTQVKKIRRECNLKKNEIRKNALAFYQQ